MKKVKAQYEKYPFPQFTGKYLDYAVSLIKSFKLPKGSVLDIGCGTGIYSCAFAKLGFDVKGIDLSDNSIKIAKKSAKSLNLKIKFESVDLFEYGDNKKYDIIFTKHSTKLEDPSIP